MSAHAKRFTTRSKIEVKFDLNEGQQRGMSKVRTKDHHHRLSPDIITDWTTPQQLQLRSNRAEHRDL
jgi:hypothetical protein